MILPFEAELALEWFHASGDRTLDRLRNLVDHYCATSGINDNETRTAIFEAARPHARLP